jgi:L-cysteine desulfidase
MKKELNFNNTKLNKSYSPKHLAKAMKFIGMDNDKIIEVIKDIYYDDKIDKSKTIETLQEE